MFRRHLRIRRGQPDYLIIVCLTLLIGFGLVMLASASSYLGKIKYDDAYFLLKHQIKFGLSFGLVFFFLTSFFYYKHYEKFSIFFLLASLGLLALVYTPLGFEANGARRWLNIAGFTFQPAEIVKLTLILYLTSWLSRNPHRPKNFKTGFVPFFLVLSAIALLLLSQPATSTTVIIVLTAMVIYFMSGAKISHIALGAGISAVALAALIYFTPYRLDRVMSFLNKGAATQTSGFHISQARNAIGSGRIFGVGYGQSTTKIRFLPEPHGDSIFAVVGEELGFIGAGGLIGVFALLVFQIFRLSRKCPDRFGSLLLMGFGTLIGIQTFVHIGAISGILPLTGIPLPFVSFGGTALAIFMTIGGIVVNISRYV